MIPPSFNANFSRNGASGVVDDDPSHLDVLVYLDTYVPDPGPKRVVSLSTQDIRQHYQALEPALRRLRQDDPAQFEIALNEIKRKLGMKPKPIKDSLAQQDDPPEVHSAQELIDLIGQKR